MAHKQYNVELFFAVDTWSHFQQQKHILQNFQVDILTSGGVSEDVADSKHKTSHPGPNGTHHENVARTGSVD